MKYGVASWSGLHIFSVEKNSLLPPLILSATGQEQSQRVGRHRSLGAGDAEKDDGVQASLSGVHFSIRANLSVSIPTSSPGSF